MGLFGIGENKVLDLNSGYRRHQQIANRRKKQEIKAEPDSFLGSIAESAKKKSYKFNPETGEKYEENYENKRKKVTNRIGDIADKIEELNNKISNLQQRLELVEKRLRLARG